MFEAIDYTPSRLPRGQTSAIVRSYMAHHQAMSLLALADLLLDHADAGPLRLRPGLQGDADVVARANTAIGRRARAPGCSCRAHARSSPSSHWPRRA